MKRPGAWAALFPKVDRQSGLHSAACECRLCEMGWRPTEGQRRAARTAKETAARMKVERERLEAVAAKKAAGLTPKALAASERAARVLAAGERARIASERAAANASPPPVGGFRAWMDEQRRKGKDDDKTK